MSQIPVMINEEVVDLLGLSGEELERSVVEAIVLGMYRRHDISARRAARLLEMEYLEFLRWSGERGVPYLDLTEEELQAEIRTARELGASVTSSR
jgi:predicted HTH domain antitoxin